MQRSSLTAAPSELDLRLEQYRAELIGYCYRVLGSPFEAEDAVQETLLKAWRGFDRFEGCGEPQHASRGDMDPTDPGQPACPGG